MEYDGKNGLKFSARKLQIVTICFIPQTVSNEKNNLKLIKMKKTILFTFIVAGLILGGCSSSNSQPKLKDMSEIEKLTKEQFAEETAAINVHVVQEMGKLLDKHSKIDANFEKDIDALHKSSVRQMVEYGKVLDKKDEKTRVDYVMASLTASWDAMDKLGTEVTEGFEAKFDARLPELEAYGVNNLERKSDDLFAIMNFLDFERIKEERPESAKEFGIK